MSTAEIVAYNAGAHYARHAVSEIESGKPPDELTEWEMTDDIWAAKGRLGETAFSYWFLKGASEGVSWQD